MVNQVVNHMVIPVQRALSDNLCLLMTNVLQIYVQKLIYTEILSILIK